MGIILNVAEKTESVISKLKPNLALWVALAVAFGFVQFQIFHLKEKILDSQYDVMGLKVLSELHTKTIDEHSSMLMKHTSRTEP